MEYHEGFTNDKNTNGNAKAIEFVIGQTSFMFVEGRTVKDMYIEPNVYIQKEDLDINDLLELYELVTNVDVKNILKSRITLVKETMMNHLNKIDNRVKELESSQQSIDDIKKTAFIYTDGKDDIF